MTTWEVALFGTNHHKEELALDDRFFNYLAQGSHELLVDGIMGVEACDQVCGYQPMAMVAGDAARSLQNSEWKAWRWSLAVARAERTAAAWACPLASTQEVTGCRRGKRLRDAEVDLPARRRFEQVRHGFLAKHGESIRSNLSTALGGPVSLTPAPIATSVIERFMEVYDPMIGLLPTFHGTNAANHMSIFERGLLIPGQDNNIKVAHGSAHGLGVYTARVTSPYLSRGYCTEPRMLVCGVADGTVAGVCPVVRHVGDAVVIFDSRRVVPLFEATGHGLRPSCFSATAQMGRRLPAVLRRFQAKVICISSATRTGAMGKKKVIVTTWTLTETGRVSRARRAEATASQPGTAAASFLARRAARRRQEA